MDKGGAVDNFSLDYFSKLNCFASMSTTVFWLRRPETVMSRSKISRFAGDLAFLSSEIALRNKAIHF